MHLRMRNGNIAISPISPSNKTPSGIFIPQTVKEGALRLGRIIETGKGELVQGQFVECDLKKGDEVLFDITHSEPVELDGNTLLICNMIDVIATVSAKHLSVVPENK